MDLPDLNTQNLELVGPPRPTSAPSTAKWFLTIPAIKFIDGEPGQEKITGLEKLFGWMDCPKGRWGALRWPDCVRWPAVWA